MHKYFYLERNGKLEEVKKKNIKSFILGTLFIINALLLFQFNVGQVSAEESMNDFNMENQTEASYETFENSDDEFKDEMINDSNDVENRSDNDGLDESSDELSNEGGVDFRERDEETQDQSEEVQERDSEDHQEDDGQEDADSDTEELDEIDTSKEDTKDSENADGEELEDTDTSEEDIVEDEVGTENQADQEDQENDDIDDDEEVNEIDEDKPMAMTASAQSNSTSEDKVEVDRIAGQNRYKNAVELSKEGWNSASTVIITNGEKFTDSLTGSPLASLHNAPILLTRSDRLPSETLAEIKRLNPNEVIALGGDLSVSSAVLETLENNGFSARRIGGRTRYLVAENVAKEVMAVEGKNRDAFLVSGEVYSDAMSIAPVAASKRLPIFLTEKNVLHQTVIDALSDVNTWTIIGGHLTISQEVQDEMDNLGAKTRRMDGRTRYDVNQNIINHYGASGDHMYVASGEHFSDATPASVLAARQKSSVLLVRDGNEANLKKQRNFANSKNTNKLTLIGGTLTLSKATADYFNNQNHLIYLDPGHGGSDTGAVGRVDGKQYLEKNLNLEVSFKVRDLLETKGYKVHMSRTNDSYVDLYRRPQEANDMGADILVSVHHNAMPGSTTVSGIETYYYQSSSNYPPLNKNKPYHNDPQRLADSKQLSELIQGELIDHTGAHDRGVRRAAFVVTREAHMPVALLELGYMSTPTDLREFSQSWYQNRLASATADGIDQYFSL